MRKARDPLARKQVPPPSLLRLLEDDQVVPAAVDDVDMFLQPPPAFQDKLMSLPPGFVNHPVWKRGRGRSARTVPVTSSSEYVSISTGINVVGRSSAAGAATGSGSAGSAAGAATSIGVHSGGEYTGALAEALAKALAEALAELAEALGLPAASGVVPVCALARSAASRCFRTSQKLPLMETTGRHCLTDFTASLADMLLMCMTRATATVPARWAPARQWTRTLFPAARAATTESKTCSKRS